MHTYKHTNNYTQYTPPNRQKDNYTYTLNENAGYNNFYTVMAYNANTVKLLIKAGSQIEAGSLNTRQRSKSVVLIKAGYPIEARSLI